MVSEELSRRERRVLEAVIRSYVETAEPAGSRTLSRRFGLGVSPATIRNTMSDLEEKGFLFHPHTSAGRIPTNKAYRLYVDSLLSIPALKAIDSDRLAEEITAGNGSSPIETILRRAAQTLGVLTQELGVALGPQLDRSVLRRLEPFKGEFRSCGHTHPISVSYGFASALPGEHFAGLFRRADERLRPPLAGDACRRPEEYQPRQDAEGELPVIARVVVECEQRGEVRRTRSRRCYCLN